MMANTTAPFVIKKYPTRRLYNTDTRAYVTLETLAAMVRDGKDFVVIDVKSGTDITRSALMQVIAEQENKEGQNLLPIAFLRQLIRFQGSSMQMFVPQYLEVLIDSLTRALERFGIGEVKCSGRSWKIMERRAARRTNLSASWTSCGSKRIPLTALDAGGWKIVEDGRSFPESRGSGSISRRDDRCGGASSSQGSGARPRARSRGRRRETSGPGRASRCSTQTSSSMDCPFPSIVVGSHVSTQIGPCSEAIDWTWKAGSHERFANRPSRIPP
jgi:polyhydroxyalkanoate synthesis repressor PhaR